MKVAKRVLVFASVNILIVATLSMVLSLLGVQPQLESKGINFQSLIGFCLLWGFGGAFISLALSRQMAKWMMGVRVIDLQKASSEELELVQKVYSFARRAGLGTMPEVGIYESEELNAFATGQTRNRALVAVSSGLLHRMNGKELEGVLAHEVAHIANGDMVTMTIAQGVVNSFVLFLARVVAWFAAQFVEEERRPMVQFGVTLVAEIGLGILGMIVVSAVSRAREFRADQEGARLSSPQSMIAALNALKRNQIFASRSDEEPTLATLKISGQGGRWTRLFSTHPELDDRMTKLENYFGLRRSDR